MSISRGQRAVMALALAGALAGSLFLGACAGAPNGPGGAADESALDRLMRVAASTRAAGDSRSAVGIYRRAVVNYPEAIAPKLALGETLSELTAYGEALQTFDAVLALEPNNAAALHGIGKVLIALDQPQRALAHFDSLLSIDPADVVAHNRKGVALDMMGEHARAQRSYLAGLALAPNNTSLQNNYGLSLALSGEFAQAVSVLRRVAAVPGAPERSRHNLALVYGLSGDTEAAAEITSVDLNTEEVAGNLAYYALLRKLVVTPEEQDQDHDALKRFVGGGTY